MTELTPEAFRKLLAENGIVLDDRAFAAAWKGAQHLRAEVARIDTYLAQKRRNP